MIVFALFIIGVLGVSTGVDTGDYVPIETWNCWAKQGHTFGIVRGSFHNFPRFRS